jgi:hypothetical protein
MPLVKAYYPALMESDDGKEYRKMIELSAKMSMVGHACTEIAGYDFDERRKKISILFGACCFLGDSFLDDFGESISREYLERFELLLTKGWFEIKNKREQLFYIVLSRLFAERDILDTMLRQAIFGQFLAQKRDVELRLDSRGLRGLPRQEQLNVLRECARDRGGYVTAVLSLLLVPELPFKWYHLLYVAGSLFMYIDDHGDYHYDRHYNRLTFMNQVKYPVQALRNIFGKGMNMIYGGLPPSRGRDFLVAFLFRYFVTRLRKHNLERDKGVSMWTVYD